MVKLDIDDELEGMLRKVFPEMELQESVIYLMKRYIEEDEHTRD